MTQRFDLVVFDFDGTLADSLTWFRSVLGDVLEHHRLKPLTLDQAEALRGLTPKAIMDELEIPAWKVPLIAADVRQRAADNADQIVLFDGIPELLLALKASGVSLAVVSSNGEKAVREVLGAELAGLFDQFACGAALFGKASVFKKVIKKAGTTPQRTLCVGDEVRDIDAAREASCNCAAVSWGFATADILADQGPCHLVSEPAALGDIVLGHQSEAQRA
ncbi:HAD hydrolase-like protein [Maricaulis sp. D1M11]|uniref:HAD hydrolase-like protein n=1 Tax=Maricaulis sp. D1M11 TaxID=3076117 RepID=UPI0039B3D431